MTWKEFVEKVGDFEGFSPTPYKCPAGVWTIGYGRTAGVNANTPATTKENEILFLNLELSGLTEYITNEYPALCLLEHQIWALSSFTYNCGRGNLKKLMAGRTRNEIGNAILLYNKAGGKVLPGLIRRRKWEHELYVGKYSSVEEVIQSVIGYKIDGRWWAFAGRTMTIDGVDHAFMAELKNVDGVIIVDRVVDGFMAVPESDITEGKYISQFFAI